MADGLRCVVGQWESLSTVVCVLGSAGPSLVHGYKP